MFGLDNPSGINVMPAITPVNNPAPLWFTEGGSGLSASYPGQEWFNQVQAELLGVLKEAGVQPDKSKLNQVAAAIRKIIQNTVPTASTTTPGIVKLSSIINSDSDTTAPTSRVVNDVYRMVSTVKRDVTAANENANNRLEKRLNGADIPDKAAFVRNLGFIAQQTGFAEDKIISQKGVTDALNGKFDKTGGYVNGEVIASQAIKSAGRIAVANPNGFSGLDLIGEHYDVIFETNGEEEPYLAIRDKVREGTNYVTIPRKSGTMALLSDMDEKVSKCFGIAQKWVDVTAQRAIDTTYTNDTGRPIAVIFTGLKNTNYINAYAVTVRVDGVTIAHMAGTHLAGIDRSISFIVPPGSMYSCSAVTHTTVGFDSWVELR